MRKWGDTYVIGVRGGAAEASKYPKLKKFASPHNDHIHFQDTPLFRENTDPTDWFWGNTSPYFIVKPEETYIPASVDITRNNMLWGMGLYRYLMTNNRLLSANMLQWFGGAFVGTTHYGDVDTMVAGGLILRDDGVYTYGTVIEDPCVQIYDKGVYNRGRKALSRLQQLLHVYIHRHKILDPGWTYYGWKSEFMWDVYRMYAEDGIDGMSPQWLLDSHQRANSTELREHNRWWRQRYENIPMLSTAQITKYWKEEGLKKGFVRLAEKGTPLYHEAPLMEPDNTDYDALIRAD